MFKYIVVLVLLQRRISGEFEFIFLFFVQLIVSEYFNLRFAFHFFFLEFRLGKTFHFMHKIWKQTSELIYLIDFFVFMNKIQ